MMKRKNWNFLLGDYMVRSSGARKIHLSAAEDNEMVCLFMCVAGERTRMVRELFEIDAIGGARYACVVVSDVPEQIIFCQI